MTEQTGKATILQTGQTFEIPPAPSVRYPKRLGEGGFETLIASNDIIVCHSDARLVSAVRLVPWTPPPLVGNPSLTFFCSFAGTFGVHPEGFVHQTRVQGGELAVFHVPGPRASFDLPPSPQRTVSGGFSLDYLRAVTSGLDLPLSVSNLIEYGETPPHVEQGRVDTRVRLILDDLLHCPYSGTAKQFYQQAKGLEFLAALSEAWSPRKAVHRDRWHRVDVERLHEARERLLSDIEEPPSLVVLARDVGMSPTKLKRGFRDLFDSTVTDILREARLQAARRLLETTNLPLKAIAGQVGYSDAANLSHAFKIRFGISPGRLRY